MERWYALHVRSQHERFVANHLAASGLEHFAPFYMMESRWSDRTKLIERPLFPGYVFARFDAGRRQPIIRISGVIQIVGTTTGPIAIDDQELEAVRHMVASKLPVTPWPCPSVGDMVTVGLGPLAGLRGIVIHRKGHTRLVCSIEILQRAVSVELDTACLERQPA